MTRTSLLLDAAGWAGAGALLLAYALISRDPGASAGHRYLVLNLTGATGLAINGIARAAWPSAALNLLWLALALTSLRRQHTPRAAQARSG